MAPERLEPGMPMGHHPALLRDLPLEQVRRRTHRRERLESVADDGAGRAQRAAGIVRQDRHQPAVRQPLRHAEERDQPPAVPHRRQHCLAEPVLGLARHRRPRHAPAVPEAERVEAAHGAPPPRLAAARASTSWSGRRDVEAQQQDARRQRQRSADEPAALPRLRQRRIGLAVRHLEDDRGHADEDDGQEHEHRRRDPRMPAPHRAAQDGELAEEEPERRRPRDREEPGHKQRARDRSGAAGCRGSSARTDVPVASTTLPTARKSSPFASPLLIRCSTVP